MVAKRNPSSYKSKRYTKRQKRLHALRCEGHSLMSQLGRETSTPRRQRYFWLSCVTGISVGECHFSTMEEEQMGKAIKEIRKARKQVSDGGGEGLRAFINSMDIKDGKVISK